MVVFYVPVVRFSKFGDKGLSPELWKDGTLERLGLNGPDAGLAEGVSSAPLSQPNRVRCKREKYIFTHLCTKNIHI